MEEGLYPWWRLLLAGEVGMWCDGFVSEGNKANYVRIYLFFPKGDCLFL